MLTEITALHI